MAETSPVQEFTHPQEVAYSYPIRPHIFFVVSQVVVLQLCVIALDLLLGYPIVAFSTAIDTVVSAGFLFTVLIVILQLINAGLIVAIVVNWMHTLYIIRPEQIVEQHGLWQVEEKTHSLEGNEGIEVDQTAFGRFFNYGTVHGKNPITNSELWLRNIPDPHMYAEVLRKTKSKEVISVLPGHENV